MRQSDIFRDNARTVVNSRNAPKAGPAFKRYMRMSQAWMALAKEQDWLDGEVPPLRTDGQRVQ